MRFHWLLPSLFTIFLLSTPAEAAKLQSWRFDTDQNRLYINTEGGVQPKAQLLANPTRLVIDLPGTTVGRNPQAQPVGGAIKSVRVGQFNGQTTRLVIELNPGYTLDPQKVIVRGTTASRWTVQLPTPQAIAEAPGDSPLEPSPGTSSDTAGSPTVLENVRVTPDGLFLRTSGRSPQVKVQRTRDRTVVNIELQNATIRPDLQGFEQAVNRYGIQQLKVSQVRNSGPVARVSLKVTNPKDEWEATVTNLGGVIVLPKGAGVASGSPNQPSESANPGNVATIEAVQLAANGSQLLIRTDKPFTYTSDWDQGSGAYKIVIASARVGAKVRSPITNARSSLSSVQIQQTGSSTVAILVRPAAGVQITELNQPTAQLLSLQLQRAESNNAPPPRSNYPPSPNSGIRNGRAVVIVDPGHGGRDVGAVGIGAIREADIVLDISLQVAQLLEQQGVQAILTRSDDREIDLEPRVQLAERVNASLFVSIHANAIDMSRPEVNGIETYYYSNGERLAATIHNSMLQSTGSRDRGVRQARFYVLRKTSMPAVLVETGFVTGAEDAPKLANAAYRQRMAEAIARGILQYIQQNR
ncbi:N-acetylmuramoyl-L-alanine amidase [Microcoleus sp. FACHB-672]|uniref:N-acetylmuramoyl-L-alanine amidase n=1 Tax=Microcoleus sp. FACHB-672 TaxID=2692825 RepID=UPI001682CD26|nr:N-acetylmuramoyl-L-alanine amidase [Microcoleus sp. FACHB-672]MBD2043567.1 N-acetylmuramoyl-L-alanine amidase [Microcoleus sp. FACHB-672]